MHDINSYSTKEARVKTDDKPLVKSILVILKDKDIDDALSILFAARRLIIGATNPKTIDSAILNQIDTMLEKYPLI